MLKASCHNKLFEIKSLPAGIAGGILLKQADFTWYLY